MDLFPQEIVTRQDSQKKNDLVGRWRNWLDNPVNRAVLMQTGIAMLQPMGPGQSPIGHLARSIGMGLQLPNRAKAAEQKQQQEDARLEIDRQRNEQQQLEMQRQVEDQKARQQLAERRFGLDERRVGLDEQRFTSQERLAQERNEIAKQRATNPVRAATPATTKDSAWLSFIADARKNADPFNEDVFDPAWIAKQATAFENIWKQYELYAAPQTGAQAVQGDNEVTQQAEITQAELANTMQKYGLSEEEVLRHLEQQLGTTIVVTP